MASQLETDPAVMHETALQARPLAAERTSPARIVSLDQFRGYTVLGMFFVNFVGGFAVIPAIFKHHNYFCSYADTIMPQFFFAVGFAYRLTFLRRLEAVGPRAAYGHAIKRNLGLLLLGFVVHQLDGHYHAWSELQNLGFWGFLTTSFQREFFQTLTHIAITSIWIMPVIAASAWIRILYGCFSAALFLWLSFSFYYDWVMERPGIDGGPLGFLTWTIPMLVGSLAYDAVAAPGARWGAVAGRLLGWSVIIMALGYGIACLYVVTPPTLHLVDREAKKEAELETRTSLEKDREAGSVGLTSFLVDPPFVQPPRPPARPVNIWTMSQRAGSLSYLIFGAGFSLALYALFILACEVGGLRLGVFATFGSNALAGYILHPMVSHAIKPFTPGDSPGWYVAGAIGLFLLICYLFIRHLEKNRLFLKL